MTRRGGALALLVTTACAVEEPVLQVGEFVDVIAYDREPCGDLAAHMDRFTALVVAALDADLEGERIAFTWFTRDGFRREARCPEVAAGCAHGLDSFSYAAPHDHELVHNITQTFGKPPVFFIEGAAVAFELPTFWQWVADVEDPGDADIVEVLRSQDPGGLLPAEHYTLAGAFTRFLIDRHELTRWKRLYARLARAATVEDIDAAFVDVFGESLADAVDAFDAERRGCRKSAFRFKTFECSAPAMAWDGQELLAQRLLRCEEDGVVGPFGDATARTHATLEVDAPGTFELAFVSDDPDSALFLGHCGGCDDAPDGRVWLRAGEAAARVSLAAGRHYVVWTGPVAASTVAALRVTRISTDE